MALGTQAVTQGGNVVYQAGVDVRVSQLLAGTGAVAVSAGGNIVDIHNDTVMTDPITGLALPTGDARIANIVAGVRLEAWTDWCLEIRSIRP